MKLLYRLRSRYVQKITPLFIYVMCLPIVCLSSLHCSRIFYSLREGGISHVSGGASLAWVSSRCKNRTYWQNKVQLFHGAQTHETRVISFCNLSLCSLRDKLPRMRFAHGTRRLKIGFWYIDNVLDNWQIIALRAPLSKDAVLMRWKQSLQQ